MKKSTFLFVALFIFMMYTGCKTPETDIEPTSTQLYSPPPPIQGPYAGLVWPAETNLAQGGHRITSNTSHAFKLYHTHPNWSPDGKWLIFISKRDAGHGLLRNNIFAMAMPGAHPDFDDYEVIQLTDDDYIREAFDASSGGWPGASTPDIYVSQKYNGGVPEYLLYYMRTDGMGGVCITELDYGQIIDDAANNTVQWGSAYARLVKCFGPSGYDTFGGISMDADGQHLYAKITHQLGSYPRFYIQKVNIQSGSDQIIYQSLYNSSAGINNYNMVDHIQANPYVPGQVMFIEQVNTPPGSTLTTVEQTMYLIDNGVLKPIFPEQEWGFQGGSWSQDNVTHATWVAADKVGFHLTSLHYVKDTSGWSPGLYTIEFSGLGSGPGTDVQTLFFVGNGATTYRYHQVISSDESYIVSRTTGNPGTGPTTHFERLNSLGFGMPLFNGTFNTFGIHSISPDEQHMVFQSVDPNGSHVLSMIDL